MTPNLIALTVFGSIFLVAGILCIIFRKKIFNIPDYKTTKYQIKIYYGSNKVTNLESIDKYLDELIKNCSDIDIKVPSDYKNKYKILIIKIWSDKEVDNYCTAMKYNKFDGMSTDNYIILRKENMDINIIKDTALLHELLHYTLNICGKDRDGYHEKKEYWDKTGILGKTLRS